jgi:uncharacterized protein (DUF433 family)
VLRNTRLPISIVFECLAKGASIDDIIEWHGGVPHDQIEQVINFVADRLQEFAHTDTQPAL